MAHVCYHTRHRAAERSWKKVIKWSEWPATFCIGGPNSVILFKMSIPLHISSHTWAKFCYTFAISDKPGPITLETLDLPLITISTWWYKLVNNSLYSLLIRLKINLNHKETIGKYSKSKKLACFCTKYGENHKKVAFWINDLTLKPCKTKTNRSIWKIQNPMVSLIL